jgi:1-carboxybiuret hydrolase subunit AtzG-like protein
MGKRVKARTTPKAKTKRVAAKKSAPARTKSARRDPLDDFIVAAGRALNLPIEPAWQPSIKSNLAVTLRLAALYADFPLPDDAEPAPVFVA